MSALPPEDQPPAQLDAGDVVGIKGAGTLLADAVQFSGGFVAADDGAPTANAVGIHFSGLNDQGERVTQIVLLTVEAARSFLATFEDVLDEHHGGAR